MSVRSVLRNALEKSRLRAEIDRLRARLAAVLALCDEEDAAAEAADERPYLFVTEVRAAAAGDRTEPAEGSDDAATS